MRRIIVVAISLVLGVGMIPQAGAAPRDRASELVAQFAHGRSVEMQGAKSGKGQHRLAPGRASDGTEARTWLAVDGLSFGLTAELVDGQTSVTFPDLVPEGFSIGLGEDGSGTVYAQDDLVASEIKAPWARDARGRAVPTWYEVDGRNLVQHVDATDAQYPIVADPWVTTGWWYTTPVYFVELSWSETWAVKKSFDDGTASGVSKLCGIIPHAGAKAACKLVAEIVGNDIKTTVNSAIANKKCYKVRLPASGGAIAMPAYDSYYKTCRS